MQSPSAQSGDAQGRNQVSSQTHKGLETMPVSEIRCFIAEQKYVTAFGPEQELLLPDTLKDIEGEFSERFLRVHRNTLVSVAHISRLQRDESGSWLVELDSVDSRPAVSRRHLSDVKERMLRS